MHIQRGHLQQVQGTMDIMHLEVLEVEDRLKVGELRLTVEVEMEQ